MEGVASQEKKARTGNGLEHLKEEANTAMPPKHRNESAAGQAFRAVFPTMMLNMKISEFCFVKHNLLVFSFYGLSCLCSRRTQRPLNEFHYHFVVCLVKK